jgi:hypothetical protein
MVASHASQAQPAAVLAQVIAFWHCWIFSRSSRAICARSRAMRRLAQRSLQVLSICWLA